MGWVTYDKHGMMIKYYKKPGPAKAAVTRAKNAPYQVYPYVVGFCTYRDFEGILLGLRGNEFKMWQFCNTQKVDRVDR